MPVATLPIPTPFGPLVDVIVEVSEPYRDALTAAGLPIPLGLHRRALLDTGAGRSLVDLTLVNTLGIIPTGTHPMRTATTGNNPIKKDIYDIKLILQDPAPFALSDCHNAIGVDLGFLGNGIGLLIGRDLLSRFLFLYNGPSNQLTISY